MSHELLFVHLSDIHFNKAEADHYDLDRDLRDQLETDVSRTRATIGAPATGILLTGDIAFAAHPDEYAAARAWLKVLCELAGCAEESVWCVPGNHDVDRSIAARSQVLQDVQAKMRSAGPGQVDDFIARYLRDEDAGPLLFKPLQSYNDFASFFRCVSRSDPLSWQHDLQLGDGSTLRLHGINSVLVSNRHDDAEPRRLVAGTIQARPFQQPGVTCLALCHHPPEWFIDYDTVSNSLNNRARIQLFGHKHFQRIEQVNNALRIGAGAVHPSRREPNWLPRYNWISLSVRPGERQRFLEITIHQRVWNEEKTSFVPDLTSSGGSEYSRHTLTLDDWRPPRPPTADESNPQSIPSPPNPSQPDPVTPMDETSAARALTYRFLELPHVRRIYIAQLLGLYTNEDEGLLDAELFERVLQRAAGSKRLEELWRYVHKDRADNRDFINPYEGR